VQAKSKFFLTVPLLFISMFLSGCSTPQSNSETQTSTPSNDPFGHLKNFPILQTGINSDVQGSFKSEFQAAEIVGVPSPNIVNSELASSINSDSNNAHWLFMVKVPLDASDPVLIPPSSTIYDSTSGFDCQVTRNDLYNDVLSNLIKTNSQSFKRPTQSVTIRLMWEGYMFSAPDKYGNPIPPKKVKSFGYDQISILSSDLGKINQDSVLNSTFTPEDVAIPGSSIHSKTAYFCSQ